MNRLLTVLLIVSLNVMSIDSFSAQSIEPPSEFLDQVVRPSRLEGAPKPYLTVRQLLEMIKAYGQRRGASLIQGWEKRGDKFVLLLTSEGVKEVVFFPSNGEVDVERVDRGPSFIPEDRYWSGQEFVGWVWVGTITGN